MKIAADVEGLEALRALGRLERLIEPALDAAASTLVDEAGRPRETAGVPGTPDPDARDRVSTPAASRAALLAEVRIAVARALSSMSFRARRRTRF